MPVGDPTLSAKEIIGNESQERMGLVINEKDIALLNTVAHREGAPIYEVGEVTGDHRFTFADDAGNPMDLALSDMFGSSPKTIMNDKAIDRSPCGTGTSARLAQLFSIGKIKIGESFTHESFIGSKFIGRVEQDAIVGDKNAIIPSIQGWAKVYGYNTIYIDDNDPYAHGFQVI